MTTAAPAKITYSTSASDMEAFHRRFDEALEAVRAGLGAELPLVIGGKEVRPKGARLRERSPIDAAPIAHVHVALRGHVDLAARAAKAAQKDWARRGYRERTAVLRRAAELICEEKHELAALTSIEVGKSRLESMGDVEESADLIDYYCAQVEEARGFSRPLGRLAPNERTLDVLLPYGVFAVIPPFNFPLALSAGMSGAALAAGNAVLYKPPEEASCIGLRLHRIYEKAGVPAGVFQFLPGPGEKTGEALWRHPGVDGIAFTGSKAVGLKIFHGFSRRFVKPVLMELGQDNMIIYIILPWVA